MESTPEEQGVDSVALGDALDLIVRQRIPIHSLLMVRHGVVVLDASFFPDSASAPHDVASVTKSVTSLLTGIAIDRGLVKSVKEPVLPLLKASADDPLKRRMTVESLLSMTSGMSCGALNGAHTAEEELDAMRQSADWIGYALKLPMRDEPGKQFAYCSVNNHLLSAVITAKTGMTLEAFAKQNLFGPLGIREWIWPADAKGLNHGWGDLHLYPRDMAKLGYLFLHDGMWGERQVVSKQYVRDSARTHAMVRQGVGYGYSWWLNLGHDPVIPEAEGRGGQRIAIVPDKDTVVVFTAGGADTDVVAPFLLRSLASDGKLPANPAALGRVRQLLRDAAMAPGPMGPPELPEIARKISGKRYAFEKNALGLQELTLVFAREDEGRVVIRTSEEEWSGAVGLDGVYRISPKGRLGLPMAVSGKWMNVDSFLLDVNLAANITRILATVRFEGDRVEVELKDTTGSFFGLKVRGVAK